MKYIKNITIFMLALAILFTFTACRERPEAPDYEYSEDGIIETESFFSAVTNENFNGKVNWRFVIADDKDTEEVAFIMYFFVDGQNRKTLAKIKSKDTDMGMLGLDIVEEGLDLYYIDYEAKTVSSKSDKIMAFEMLFINYAEVEFGEENSQWEFLEQKAVTIPNAEGKDIETVEFSYNNIDEDSNTTSVKVNFNKKLPTIERVLYTVKNGEKTNTVMVYMDFSHEVSPDIFEIPTEEDGFTIIED